MEEVCQIPKTVSKNFSCYLHKVLVFIWLQRLLFSITICDFTPVFIFSPLEYLDGTL